MKRSLFIILVGLFFTAIAVIVIGAIDFLQKETGSQVNVSPQPQSVVIRPEDPYRGPADAEITIVEFGSFTCESCRQASATVKQLQALYPADIKLVWKDYPHDLGVSRTAALAARCAQLQGKFWDYHDGLFALGGEITYTDLVDLAESLSLRSTDFIQCLNENRTLNLVEADIADGAAIQIEAVPFFDINNVQQIIGDVSIGRWRQIIDSYL